jgi:hypothetical protein
VIGASGDPGTQGVGFGARRQVGAGEQPSLGQQDRPGAYQFEGRRANRAKDSSKGILGRSSLNSFILVARHLSAEDETSVVPGSRLCDNF